MHPLMLTMLMLLLSSSLCWAQPATAPKVKPDKELIRWLEERSMLYQAKAAARKVSGSGVQWRHPYAEPRPDLLIQQASVWLLDYPGSVVPKPGESVIATWANDERWATLQDLGIDLLHTGPVKLAGGVQGKEKTPTIDGWFDRIALTIDPQLGTEDEYQRMVAAAKKHDALIAGDLVPLHTGLGFDFRLAQMNYQDYPGMYSMVSIRKDDWNLLPKVDEQWGSAHVSRETATKLMEKGYLPGIINSNDAAPEAKEWSGWSASGPVVGVDGKTRRWVYLHYFKPGQPTLNWLDPSEAAPRAVYGDLTKTVHTLGTKVMRLDAVPFLGIEKEPEQKLTMHYMHPLSLIRTREIAQLARKLGGWTFHELNIPLQDLKRFTNNGPDISYDFFTRAQSVHSLLMGDAATLRQAYGFLLEKKVSPATLLHDLQNHDEITYQLVELDFRGDNELSLGDKTILGRQLKERMLNEMRAEAAGKSAPYNLLYRPAQDGLATTFAGFVAAALDIRDPYHATPEQAREIQRGHLLLAHFNAMQPGIFGISSWDLVGALPLHKEQVEDRIDDGDYRWVNRGGVDLMDNNPNAKKSAFGLPIAQSLYGSLPEQLKEDNSFASQLKRMLAARKQHRIAEGEVLAVPEPKNTEVCLIQMRLPKHPLAVTVLNFGRKNVTEELDFSTVTESAGRKVIDVVTGEAVGTINDEGRLSLKLAGWQARTLVVQSNNGEK